MSLKNRHEWNWQPTLPIKLSPILDWPPNFLLLFKWLASYWLHISSIIIEVLLAIFIFYLFHPSAEEMKNFSFCEIARIKSPYKDKLAIPRNSGLCPSICAEIIFNSEVIDLSAIEDLKELNYIWVIFVFHENYLIFWLPIASLIHLSGLFGSIDLRVLFVILAGLFYFPIQCLEIYRLIYEKRIERGYFLMFSSDSLPRLPQDHFFK